MKKISLIYLLVIFIFGCSNDGSEDIDESSGIVQQVITWWYK